MNNRLDLHALLISIGGPNVYYQAPANIVMKYPAIRYTKDKIENTHADNSVYSQHSRYEITIISKTVDDDIVSKISMLSMCAFDRAYIKDNLYHSIFNMYY